MIRSDFHKVEAHLNEIKSLYNTIMFPKKKFNHEGKMAITENTLTLIMRLFSNHHVNNKSNKIVQMRCDA